MIKKRTFFEYLSQHEAGGGSDDLFGDFSHDAANDAHFPCGVEANSSGFIEAFNYLYFEKSVDPGVLVAFMECWQEYYAVSTGRRWEEWVNDNLL